ncbi:hypothetical protein BHM03_00039874 [Ensete ventricosum]|nr:hypothetical protein BHM03_00039874 [Ensete ventricosum]
MSSIIGVLYELYDFSWPSINRRGDSWLIGCSFSLPLLFSSLPLRKSCEIRLEEFRLNAARKGQSAIARSFTRAAASDQRHQQGWPPATGPQGAALARDLPVGGSACRRPGRKGSTRSQPVEGWHPQRRCLPTRCHPRAVAPIAQGQGDRQRRATLPPAQRGQEGLGQYFLGKDDPTPSNSRNFEDCPRV